ncbi:MAG: PDZ domain-containing protein [Cyclobacteriaceae bacterium]|nr:PDZ domain-containing protein [Cyclobacteriaceae bacterium]
MITAGNKKLLLFLFLFILLNGCYRHDDPFPADDDTKEADVNEWIWEKMNTYYYWEDLLVDTDRSDPDHKSYFNSLLYEDDGFSWISDDAETLRGELDGEILALGFSPAFGVFSNSRNIFIVVEYVYPGSNAEVAGLKRGDIILKIDGQDLTEDNYLDLYDKTEYTLSLGEYNGSGIYETDNEIFIVTNTLEVEPVVYSEVFEADAHRIGYLVYVDFISGNDDSKLEDLGQVIDGMKMEGITELIIDLRYNRGGDVGAAKYFGSLLAPEVNIQNRDVFIRFDYNDFLENYYHHSEGENSDHLNIRFEEAGYHLDLEQVIILTSSHTASASELLLVGLEPYMQVVSIGEPTFGKFYGSFVLFDENDPPRHNWAIVPVVLKYANANGFSDFVNGVDPDYYVPDNLLEAKPFGDLTDPMMARAVSQITGNPLDENARTAPMKSYEDKIDWNRIRKGNLLMVPEDR